MRHSVLAVIRFGALVNDVDWLKDGVCRENPDEIVGLDYSNEIGWHAILPAPVR
jgi:hypothetical protein